MKIFNSKLVLLSVLFIIQYSIKASINTFDTLKIEADCNAIVHRWVEQDLKLTKNCVGFSAPIAARALNYISIGMYESIIDFVSHQKSLSNQLTDFNRTTWNSNKLELHLPCVLNEVNYLLATFFYKNMPPKNLIEVEQLYKDLNHQYSKNVSKKTITNSKDYATKLSEEIIEWSKKDGGNEAYKRNFPSTFIIENCKSCWTKTTPGYQSALLPYWGNNKLLIHNNNICKDIPFIKFSSDTLSEFYKDALKLNTLNANFTAEQKIIAKFWDDSPGYSGSPAGHIFSIANDLSIKYNKTLQQTCELFVMLGIGLNDALIECWKLKYQHNLIRPITYIQRYINPNFNTLIITPPFPEFPSGHSFQAGVSEEIFKYDFSDTLIITDKTNAMRTDINGNPRSFSSFTKMSEEISLSRFYGGIHYLNTLKVSLEYGRKIGLNTISSLSLKK